MRKTEKGDNKRKKCKYLKCEHSYLKMEYANELTPGLTDLGT